MVLLPSFFDGLCEGPDGGPFQHTQAPFVLDDFRALWAELFPAVLAKLLRKQEAPCLPKHLARRWAPFSALSVDLQRLG